MIDDLGAKVSGAVTLLLLVAAYRVSAVLAIGASVTVGVVLMATDRTRPSWTDIGSRAAGGVILIANAAVGGSVAVLAGVVDLDHHTGAVDALALGGLALAWSLACYAPFARRVLGEEFRTYLAMFPRSFLRQGIVSCFVLGVALIAAASTRSYGGGDHWLSPLLVAIGAAVFYAGWCSADVILHPDAPPSDARQNETCRPRRGRATQAVGLLAIVGSFVYGVVVDAPTIWGFATVCSIALTPGLARREREHDAE